MAAIGESPLGTYLGASSSDSSSAFIGFIRATIASPWIVSSRTSGVPRNIRFGSVRAHSTIRTAPAVAAGLASAPMPLREFVEWIGDYGR
jgi:hypothetical protein